MKHIVHALLGAAGIAVTGWLLHQRSSAQAIHGTSAKIAVAGILLCLAGFTVVSLVYAARGTGKKTEAKQATPYAFTRPAGRRR